MQKMTRDEALKLLDLYRNWNVGQKSVTLAISGQRTAEDDIFDKRREAILLATTVLAAGEIREHFKNEKRR